MDTSIIVSTQLSSLFSSSQVTSIPLQTSRRNTPLSPALKDSDAPAEHASYVSLTHISHVGTVLLRVLHGGLIIEIVSLSAQVPPIRFVFPAPVLPTPAIFTWDENELHILAVTERGSLYRLVLPTSNPSRLWHDQVSKNWCREYLIKNVQESVMGIVQAQGPHCVAIGFNSGGLLRIETERVGDDNNDDLWTESLFNPGSFFGSLTAYLPSLHSGSSSGSEIISITSHPQPTDLGHIWTLSRDRTLRLWTAKGGCVAAKALSSPGRASSPAPGSNPVKSHVLLEADPRILIRIFSTASLEDSIYVLAFTPTPSAPHSGGFFQLFDSSNEYMREIQTIECSSNSVHCYLQDFIVVSGVLYTLWDRQGSSMTEQTAMPSIDKVKQAPYEPNWKSASYAQEVELTPAYLDELLLSPGSLTGRFLEAILRPGMFSALTLRTAIDQYTDACMSLPGQPPSPLLTTYGTIAENIAAVVGCTVNLLQDPQTGALQHERYWNALKRDWEGFIARCREIERSARWPLALGMGEQKDEVIILERERIGTLVKEDLPLRIYRHISSNLPVEPHFALLDVLWTLRNKLGPQALLNLESRVTDIIHQEIAFPFIDIIQDQAQRSNFQDDLDEGLESWIIGRLQSIEDIDRDARVILDLVAGFDQEVKREEDEVELLLPPVHSDWSTASTAEYVSITLHARYDMCFAVVILLFFLAEDLGQWDPSLLEEVFAVFRGLAMLRAAARQPVADISERKIATEDSLTADDVITRMSNMQVSRTHSRLAPTHSLIHCLLSQHNETGDLPGAAHRFLDSTGLLQSTSPTHVTKFEVLFCERLRLLGYYEVAREMLSWLPRTPGVVYVQARLWINLGRVDDAAYLMEKMAGSFGDNSGLSFEDDESLAAVLPGAVLFDSEFTFYLHATSLFKSAALTYHEISFARLALATSPPHVDTAELWYTIIRGYTELGRFEDAYSSIVTTPHGSLKRECVSHVVYRMCEENSVEKLMSFNFAGLAAEVEDALAFKARNTDPRICPFYSRILYAWYTSRGDHRNAARTIYQRARKLQDLAANPADFVALSEEQIEGYLLAMNSLSLLDQKGAWFVIPASPENGSESRKRRKLSTNIPASSFNVDKPDSEIVELNDIQYDHAFLSARLNVIRREPSLISAAEGLLSPASIVLRLGQAGQFSVALATARSLRVDMSDLFSILTNQCLRLSRNPDSVMQEDTSDWLLTDNVSSWPGSPADRGWRFLRQSLERHDSAETDYSYSKATLETILVFDRTTAPPPWLIHMLEDHHPEYLIRSSLRFEIFEGALEQTLSLVRKSDARLARDPPKTASSTWLPYTLIDQVLIAAASQNDLSSRGQALQRELQKEISNRVKRMQKANQSLI
ncbi:hypothetical protein SERLA73DRAFT_158827 [Serpula lacrymans var. lacrymans S7.3]|uniref:Nuclear pore complex protein Nup160 n=2 Tax=Serpula lacrymans var. lacrymans TaxID=341189 RepID=F8PQD9_SERL3|nr:uncharacterized protein SERLADRAFT_446435 [Serpula lacrymans var. lacrymans S7.9]EGO01552.1 hypothetical protein SERLA73DRAFT_158827 [Serpula lacrymans var. lacrymans S7.3]EGO27207.1 hypothetical protein SERLADRAFT_446435 [Serpula lacrymans var. lacrymans S7.9]